MCLFKDSKLKLMFVIRAWKQWISIRCKIQIYYLNKSSFKVLGDI